MTPTLTEPTSQAASEPATGLTGRPTGTGRHRKAEPVRARRRPLRVVSGLLLALGAVAAVGAAVLVVVLHIGFAPVLSPSMQPGFAPGDLLITRQIPASAVRVGDVVVLPRPDAPGQRYAHRIISVRTENGLPVVRTKGDANPAPDPQALRIESAGVPEVIGHVPWIGRRCGSRGGVARAGGGGRVREAVRPADPAGSDPAGARRPAG